MSGTELSRVRTELRLLRPEPNNQRLLASRGADIVMQSNGFWLKTGAMKFRASSGYPEFAVRAESWRCGR
jgi:hypothetical protein